MVADAAGSLPLQPTVAIVGMGPKGLYCLERLVAEFCADPLPEGLHVAVFNRTGSFGASPIYDPDEPEYLLVNSSVGEIDLWTTGDPGAAAGRGPDFVTWYEEEYRREAPLTGDEYLSRAVVGRYLGQGFDRVLGHLPPGVRVSCLVGDVTDITPAADGGYRLAFVDAGGRRHEVPADKVVLATGHAPVDPGPEARTYEEFAARHPRLRSIPFVYPVANMDAVPPGGRVAMKGIGLTFIDGVLALTEGRGGRFERAPDGSLAYRASGNEPQTILPFSTTGLPMAPKPFDHPRALRPLSFVTPTVLAGLRRRSPEGKIDLEADLWPLIELEMQLQYYRVVMADGRHREELDAAQDADALHRVVDSFLHAHPDQARFDHRPVLDPVGDRRFASGAEFHSFVDAYMDQEIARARLGMAGSAVKAAISVWNEVRTALSPFMAFGGLTPASHRRLMETYHRPLKRVVFGPPIVNIEKLLALQRAGVLDFSVARGARVVTDDSRRRFVLRCDSIPGAESEVETLVDARYPPVDVRRDATPLYRNLRRRGMVRAFANQSTVEGEAPYRPGAIDMVEGSHFVVGADGMANEDIAVLGVPTEGNLLGNFSVTRDEWAGTWAAGVIRQLRHRPPPAQSPAGAKVVDGDPRA